MADEQNSANWTQFPLTHQLPFNLILLECSPKDLLSCRATCTTWFSWFSSSSTIWSKYYSSFTTRLVPSGYRLAKLLEVPVAGEAGALSLSFKVHRALKENESVMSQETLGLLKAIEKRVPVLASPSVFIRLKVNNPAVTIIVNEFLDRLLGAILVDKSIDETRKLLLMIRSPYQFYFIDIVKKKTEPSVDAQHSLELEGEDKFEEARRMSLEAAEVPGEKRKRNESEKPRLDSENHDNEWSSESIYAAKDTVNPEFPTILELLSIDQPLVEELLVNKFEIDTSLVVPLIDEYLHHPGLLSSDMLLVGCDLDGEVASVRPTFCQEPSKIENHPLPRGGNKLEYWGGRDIRCRWPEFAKQLDKID